jgi:prolipoprotein diacylglyceryl transferase
MFHYSVFAADPQSMILSTDGSLPGAIIFAALFAYQKYRELKKEELPEPAYKEVLVPPSDLMGSIVLMSALGGFLGAKIFHNLENPAEFIEDPIGSMLSFSGLTMYGGLILATLLIYRHCKKNGISFWVVADALAPVVMLAYAIGRVGCHLSGDGDWGIVNTAPAPAFIPSWLWSYDYPNNVINDGVLIPGCQGQHCFHLPEPVFPTPLYESIACTLLFSVLWAFRNRFTNTGTMFGTYLILNGVERFFIELIRVNEKYHIGNFAFTQAELIAVLLVISGIWIVKKSRESAFQ